MLLEKYKKLLGEIEETENQLKSELATALALLAGGGRMTSKSTPGAPALPQALISDVRQLIESSRTQLARTVNSALTLLYWQIGQRVRNEVLQGERAEYGEQIVSTLAA